VDDDSLVTAQDVRDLNWAAVDRAAALARIAGTSMVVIGAVTLLAWLWVVVRSQDTIDDVGFTLGGPVDGDPDLATRLDVFASTISVLAFGGLVLGLGAAVRLLADDARTRVGGSVTGFVEGDELPAADGPSDELEG
jgi:hypothetical protein